ncbi:chorion peroxidase-like [Macrobrachium nipponense]|uniref:chorion peroxidase-like n=1 Tax=Macrobrachium nipponense TaxID=159736 RepID=UPI0030C8C8F0
MMGIRLVLLCYFCVLCKGQLINLLPLKGVLYDFEGPRDANVSVGFDRGPSFAAPEPVMPVEKALEQGAAVAFAQDELQNQNPSPADLELSSKFHAAFRKAEIEAIAASCVGRALLETTKDLAQRLDLPLPDAVRVLTGIHVNPELCREILRRGNCVDFPEPSPCNSTHPYRRIDGSCNNLQNPKWGQSNRPFVRLHHPFYENGIDSMRGEGRTGPNRLPSPRTVSFNLFVLGGNGTSRPYPNANLLTMQFGQFLDHDITFTPETQILAPQPPPQSSLAGFLLNRQEPVCPALPRDTVPLNCCGDGRQLPPVDLPDCRPIDVSADPIFQADGKVCMRFVRSLIASKGCTLGPREQLNQLTSYVDGSQIYGSTDRVASELRTFQGGRLKKTPEGDLLPQRCCSDREFTCFQAGDNRLNEQPGLASIHTLWLRVHENIAGEFARVNPQWDDETLYQETRRVVVALLQQVTYREWLPVVLGPSAVLTGDLPLLQNAPGKTYSPETDATLANVIATAAMRFGHTLINDFLAGRQGEIVQLVGNFGNARALFQPNTRPSALMEGLTILNSQTPDSFLVETLINRLFASREARTAFDLMSLNIQRGRDHGLPPYNTWRKACQLRTFSSFSELSSAMPAEVAQVFQQVYSDVNEIDLFPAAISEFTVEGGLLGPTFACLFVNQYSRLKKGDRFFYQNMMQPKPFLPTQLQSIGQVSYASLICQNTDIQNLQPEIFKSAGLPGNAPRPCSSYPKLDFSLWHESNITTGPGSMCMGVGPFRGNGIYDHWCTINCFHAPPFCPPTHCRCK